MTKRLESEVAKLQKENEALRKTISEGMRPDSHIEIYCPSCGRLGLKSLAWELKNDGNPLWWMFFDHKYCAHCGIFKVKWVSISKWYEESRRDDNDNQG